jgi:hypothetical protein
VVLGAVVAGAVDARGEAREYAEVAGDEQRLTVVASIAAAADIRRMQGVLVVLE